MFLVCLKDFRKISLFVLDDGTLQEIISGALGASRFCKDSGISLVFLRG